MRLTRCPVCGSEYPAPKPDFPALSRYSHLIYKAISDFLQPSEAALTIEIDVLGRVAGIGNSTEYWTRSTIENVAAEDIRQKMLDAWDTREALRLRLSEAYKECNLLEQSFGQLTNDDLPIND